MIDNVFRNKLRLLCFNKKTVLSLAFQGLILAVVLFYLPQAASCYQSVNKTILVPEDYPLIQQAIDAAKHGDTIFVSPGTYRENLTINKSVSVIGDSYETTKVFGVNEQPVVSVKDVVEGRIEGFQLRGRGVASAGVVVENSSFAIKSNRIAYAYGEGVWANEARVAVEENVIEQNWGSGVFFTTTHPDSHISNNIIRENGWAGVKVEGKGHGTLRGNSIVDNKGSGIHAEVAGTVVVERNEITHNGLAGLTCYTVSEVDLGGGPGGSIGQNIIHSNENAAVWNVTRWIFAKHNWWGSAQPGERLFYGNVDWSDHLTYAPDLDSNVNEKEIARTSPPEFKRDNTLTQWPKGARAPEDDGTKVIFEACRFGQYEIVATDLDGENMMRLTNSPRSDELPNVKPDGRWIVYSSQLRPFYDIYMSNHKQRVQLSFEEEQHDMAPTWHTSEPLIAYHTVETVENAEIFLLEIENGKPGKRTQITFNEHIDAGVSWSPDGESMAFYSNRDGDTDIYTMTRDGRNVRQHTFSPHGDLQPDWSPDGKSIVFHSGRDGNREIYVVNLETLEETRLTHHPADECSPAWSADGKYITFHTNRFGNYDIIVMPADGSYQVGIALHFTDDMDSQFTPW